MPSISDFAQFLGGQAFGRTTLPHADLIGKTIVITGANSGLGLDCAKQLARMGISRLILGCRSIEKGETAKAAILSDVDSSAKFPVVEVWSVDLDSYASAMEFAKRVRSDLDRLDGFIANAGVEPQSWSMSEGLERTLNVNIVSTYLLVLGVLPRLRETAASLNQQTTLTIVGSMAHLVAQPAKLDIELDQDILSVLSDPRKADMEGRYEISKLISILLYLELAERSRPGPGLSGSVVINTVNPGWCDTALHRDKSPPLMERAAFMLIGRTSEQGSRTLVDAVCAGPKSHGQYLSECTIKLPSSFVRSEDGQELQKRLWTEVIQRLDQIWPGVGAEV